MQLVVLHQNDEATSLVLIQTSILRLHLVIESRSKTELHVLRRVALVDFLLGRDWMRDVTLAVIVSLIHLLAMVSKAGVRHSSFRSFELLYVPEV